MSRDFIFYRKNYKCGAIIDGNIIYIIDYLPAIKLIKKYDFTYAEHNDILYYPDDNNCIYINNVYGDLIFSIYHVKNNSVVDFARYHFHIININPPRQSIKILQDIKKKAEEHRKTQEESILSYLSDEEEEYQFKNICMTHLSDN
jgi:hypothetical protein